MSVLPVIISYKFQDVSIDAEKINMNIYWGAEEKLVDNVQAY
jgi:hypothetical protein